MSITTKGGDKGMTSLYDGTRVSKDDARIELNGELDELSAYLGLCKATTHQSEPYSSIQRELMIVMAMVAGKGSSTRIVSEKIQEQEHQQVASLDAAIVKMETFIHEQTDGKRFDFVLPGRDIADASLHIARTKARTAERLWVAMNKEMSQQNEVEFDDNDSLVIIGRYLNRLSDYLWCLTIV